MATLCKILFQLLGIESHLKLIDLDKEHTDPKAYPALRWNPNLIRTELPPSSFGVGAGRAKGDRGRNRWVGHWQAGTYRACTTCLQGPNPEEDLRVRRRLTVIWRNAC
jgi:hypothetical protein